MCHGMTTWGRGWAERMAREMVKARGRAGEKRGIIRQKRAGREKEICADE